MASRDSRSSPSDPEFSVSANYSPWFISGAVDTSKLPLKWPLQTILLALLKATRFDKIQLHFVRMTSLRFLICLLAQLIHLLLCHRWLKLNHGHFYFRQWIYCINQSNPTYWAHSSLQRVSTPHAKQQKASEGLVPVLHILPREYPQCFQAADTTAPDLTWILWQILPVTKAPV